MSEVPLLTISIYMRRTIFDVNIHNRSVRFGKPFESEITYNLLYDKIPWQGHMVQKINRFNFGVKTPDSFGMAFPFYNFFLNL